MTSESSIDAREVIFVNQACDRDYNDLPHEVGETADGAIDALQNGRPLSSTMFGPLQNDKKLAGIFEIKLPYGGDTYRVYVWLGCPQAVFVLDAGEKKSPSGRGIPQWQKERLAARLAAAKSASKDDARKLEKAFNERAKRRAEYERTRNR